MSLLIPQGLYTVGVTINGTYTPEYPQLGTRKFEVLEGGVAVTFTYRYTQRWLVTSVDLGVNRHLARRHTYLAT